MKFFYLEFPFILFFVFHSLFSVLFKNLVSGDLSDSSETDETVRNREENRNITENKNLKESSAIQSGNQKSRIDEDINTGTVLNN